MSEPSSLESLPDKKVEKIRDFYVELLCLVPPRIQAHTDLLARIDPELLNMQEELRRHCMYPDCFDTKTSQFFLFAILLTNLRDAAKALRNLDADAFQECNMPEKGVCSA